MRLLRQLPGGAEVPVVVVSASTTTEERARVLSAGADGFVSKPVRESGIFSEIARLTRAKLVYAGESEPAAVDAGPLTHARVAMVPIVLRRKLLDAITRGYPDVIATEIDAIERCAPDVARELRVLADGFAYEQLFDLLHLD